MSLEQLRKLREEQKTAIERRDTADKSIHIIVGMGTCGIAAGAKDALNVFLGEAYTRKLDNVVVKLRRKLRDDAKKPKHILTVYGTGYKLVL